MARPIKTGLDYFPKDTSVFSDRKIKKLISEFGASGFMVYEYLLCVIYADKGYYAEHDSDLHFDIASNLGNGISEELVDEVILGCFRIGLLNETLYKNFKIYTSNGIQKRYLLAKRNAKIKSEFLINATETQVNDAETNVIATETQVNDAESTQSKVKESKEKENKQKGDISESEFIDVWKRARLYYDKKKSGFDKLLQFERQNFNSLLIDFSKKEFEYAVAGLFFQETVPAVRVRPEWLLKRENFEKMLDCWLNQAKIFDKKQSVSETQKFQKGDI